MIKLLLDCDGLLHATWCRAVTAANVDDPDLCDCNPCSCCEGAGHVINEEGQEETCGQCGGNPHRRQPPRGSYGSNR